MTTWQDYKPKSPKTIKDTTRLDQLTAERLDEPIWHNEDGFWLYYKTGWCSGIDPNHPEHYEVYPTKQQAISHLKKAVRCTCKDCSE
jgi:hypothetical protein